MDGAVARVGTPGVREGGGGAATATATPDTPVSVTSWLASSFGVTVLTTAPSMPMKFISTSALALPSSTRASATAVAADGSFERTRPRETPPPASSRRSAIPRRDAPPGSENVQPRRITSTVTSKGRFATSSREPTGTSST